MYRISVAQSKEQQGQARLAVGIAEAADLLGVGRSTLHRMVRAGEIPHVRIGRRVIIPMASLTKWLDERASAEWRSHDDPANGGGR